MSTPSKSAKITVVGQGIAGSALAWEFLKAGIDFELVDRGHTLASSRVGAGIINPITGQRLVTNWRVAEYMPVARALYSEIEHALGIRVLSDQRVRRIFRDDRERRIFAEKHERGELAPWLGDSTSDGFWIEGACRVDTAKLLIALRAHLRGRGCLAERAFDPAESDPSRLVIWCTGSQLPPELASLPLKPAFGEIATIRARELPLGVILNRGHWILPIEGGCAKVGATFVVKDSTTADVPSKIETLLESAEAILGRPVEVLGRDTGWRMTTPDRHPVCGRLNGKEHVGVLNGLGSKGALLAPALAQAWVAHLKHGQAFDPAMDPNRFAVAGTV